MQTLRLLHIGDVVGEVGVQTVVNLLPNLRSELDLDVVVCNSENIHQGRGLNERQCRRLFGAGVDVQTGGDHSFDKHLIFGYLNKEPRLLRPANYPRTAPGRGFGLFDVPSAGVSLGVVNLRGLAFFGAAVQHPADALNHALRDLQPHTNLVFVDYHAEATGEKASFAWWADGRVSAVSGTHTHVPTADARILPKGTGFMTDVGFTGAAHSIIGLDVESGVQRFLQQIPRKTQLGQHQPRLQGAVYELNLTTGQCVGVQPVSRFADEEAVLKAVAELGDEGHTGTD